MPQARLEELRGQELEARMGTKRGAQRGDVVRREGRENSFPIRQPADTFSISLPASRAALLVPSTAPEATLRKPPMVGTPLSWVQP